MEFEICEEFGECWVSYNDNGPAHANHAPSWAAAKRGSWRQSGVMIPEEGAVLAQPDLVQPLAA